MQKKIKIAIDCRSLQSPSSGGGIGRYTSNLYNAIADSCDVHLLFKGNKNIPNSVLQDDRVTVHTIGLNLPKTYFLWENISLPIILNKLKPDIYHAPANDGVPLFKPRQTKIVVTIHDIIPVQHPEDYSVLSLIRWHFGIRRSIRNADLLLTDSFHAKNQIMAYFKRIKCRFEVVYPFVDNLFKPLTNTELTNVSILNNYMLSKPYIAYHGGFRKYKRVDKIVNIFNKLRSISEIQPKLCLIGGIDHHFKQNIEDSIKASKYLNDIICVGRVSDSELRLLLGHADCFIYLSECEGFGFPPIEAALCGAKVVCVNAESMPECLGNYPVWIDLGEEDTKIACMVSDILLAANTYTKQVFDLSANLKINSFASRIRDVYQATVNRI
jgi:glycosyltransferase involved in cell wall biosynthesis